jgi:uncharacterized protein (TIGR02646 family)
MVTILKQREPQAWINYRRTPGVAYQALPELRQALLEEQGYICAYCMRRIPVRDRLQARNDDIGETSRIEHIHSRERYTERALDYTNMVICCPGMIDGTAHCDRSKANQDISFTPLEAHIQSSITYGTKDGEIKSDNRAWNGEINIALARNNPLLKRNRVQVLAGIRAVLEKKKWKKTELEKRLEEWQGFKDGKKKPYCGIVIWYLEKKIRQMV